MAATIRTIVTDVYGEALDKEFSCNGKLLGNFVLDVVVELMQNAEWEDEIQLVRLTLKIVYGLIDIFLSMVIQYNAHLLHETVK